MSAAHAPHSMLRTTQCSAVRCCAALCCVVMGCDGVRGTITQRPQRGVVLGLGACITAGGAWHGMAWHGRCTTADLKVGCQHPLSGGDSA